MSPNALTEANTDARPGFLPMQQYLLSGYYVSGWGSHRKVRSDKGLCPGDGYVLQGQARG